MINSNGSKNESWFDRLVIEMNESGQKTSIDKKKIDECFNHFKSSSESSDAREGLQFEDFCNLLNQLFVDHSPAPANAVAHHTCDGAAVEEVDGAAVEEVDGALVDGEDDTSSDRVTVENPTNFNSFYIPKSYYIELFQKFDRDRDNMIDRREFNAMWGKWIQTILRPKSAFIIVDVQNDFINGSLAIFRCPAGKLTLFAFKL